jgi:NAD(P)-dependent dehydrogenase (short-subunit alcohol dehydrogenase family)
VHVRFGRLDYVVINAGIEGEFAGIANLPEQEWDRVLRYRYYDSCPWQLCDPMTLLTQLVSWGSEPLFRQRETLHADHRAVSLLGFRVDEAEVRCAKNIPL